MRRRISLFGLVGIVFLSACATTRVPKRKLSGIIDWVDRNGSTSPEGNKIVCYKSPGVRPERCVKLFLSRANASRSLAFTNTPFNLTFNYHSFIYSVTEDGRIEKATKMLTSNVRSSREAQDLKIDDAVTERALAELDFWVRLIQRDPALSEPIEGVRWVL